MEKRTVTYNVDAEGQAHDLSSSTEAVSTRRDPTTEQYPRDLREGLRLLVVAGIPVGVVVAGIGSRLAMLLLRLTSPHAVRGVQSDDDFTIGKFTLGGTYNLLVLGATVGIIGAAAYQWVRPWLLGPWWFRRLTTAFGSGVVVGSLLLHSDGIDFRVLQPTWLAIGLFIALPALFGLVIGPAVDRVGRPGSWTRRGWKRWALPLVLVALFPPTLFVLAVSTVVLAVWLMIRTIRPVEMLRTSTAYGFVVRSIWLIIAMLGLVALTNDITAIAAIA
jgi:hypothetical protein